MTYELNEYQEAWLRDLETTKAKQCESELTNGKGGYCCLGRAYVANGHRAVNGKYEGESSVLGPIMIKKLKLNNRNGNYGGHLTLVHLNDDDELSFKEIAAFIRANPEKLFTDG